MPDPVSAGDGDPGTLRVLTVEGELDVQTVRALGADLAQAAGDPTDAPVVDLRRVTFMDSTALGVLVHAAERLRRQGRSLGLLVGTGHVDQLLETTGLRDRFELIDRLPGEPG